METKQQPILCIMLIVTNACNLHCRYCFEGHKNPRKMTLDTGKRILAKALSEEGRDVLKVDFFGGEPFLNFPLIKELCEWAWNEYPQKDICFFTTTNGVTLTPAIREWLRENKSRFLGSLSLDGTPEMQKINRGAVIDLQDIQLFRELWPGQGVNMTVSQETLPMMAEGIRYIHSLGFQRFKVSLARGPQWKAEEVEVYKRELEKVVGYCLEHSELKPYERFEDSLIPLLNEKMMNYHCGAGKTMRAYDPEGNLYPCHLFAPNSVDSEAWRKIAAIDLQGDTTFLHDEDCQKCIICNICKTCVGQNYKERGDIGKRDKALCPFFIVENVMIARYKLQVLGNKPFEAFDKFDYLELKAAKKLVDEYESSVKR